jgi:hypothetical protein
MAIAWFDFYYSCSKLGIEGDGGDLPPSCCRQNVYDCMVVRKSIYLNAKGLILVADQSETDRVCEQIINLTAAKRIATLDATGGKHMSLGAQSETVGLPGHCQRKIIYSPKRIFCI